MKSGAKRILAIALLCRASCDAFAVKNVFVDSANPPPGFELAHHQYLRVTVMLGNESLGLTHVTLYEGQLTFQTPETIAARLHNLNNKKGILSDLKQAFPLNIQCIHDDRLAMPDACSDLNNQPLYVIYNPQKETVHLFLAPTYFKKPKIDNALEFIPGSTESWSYLNKLGANGSFSNTESWSQVYSSLPNYYNLYSNNIFAYKNSNFVANISQNNGVNDGEHFQIQNAYFQTFDQDKAYKGGYFINPVSPFFQTEIVAGFAIESTLETVKNKENLAATPVVIFVPQASQVSIFRSEQLIFSQYLTAGYHKIDTRGFPEGGYELLIKIGDSNPEQRFFTKGLFLPPARSPQFYVLGGYLTNGIVGNRNYDFLPNILNVPVLQAGDNIRLSQTLALSSDLLLYSKQGLLDFGPTFYVGNAYIKAAGLVGTHSQYGAYLMLNTQFNRFNLNLIATKIVYQNACNNYYFLNNLTDNDSVTINYQLTPWDLIGIQGNYTRSLFQEDFYNTGAYYQHMIGQYRDMRFFLNVGYNNSFFANQSYYLSLMMNFGRGPLAASESIVAQNQNKTYSNNQIARPAILQGSTTYSHQNDVGIGYAANETHTLSQTVQSIAGIYDYTTQKAFASTYATFNRIQGQNNAMGYGGSLETELALNQGSVMLNGLNRGNASGIVVRVTTDNPDDSTSQFALLNSYNQKVAVIPANQKVFISVPAFTDEQFTLVNLSHTDYRISHPTRRITLYPGNIAYYAWSLQKRLIVIGRLFTADKHESLSNAWVHRGQNGVFTDDEGYFQLELPLNTTKLDVDEPAACHIHLPHLNAHKNYQFLGDLACT